MSTQPSLPTDPRTFLEAHLDERAGIKIYSGEHVIDTVNDATSAILRDIATKRQLIKVSFQDLRLYSAEDYFNKYKGKRVYGTLCDTGILIGTVVGWYGHHILLGGAPSESNRLIYALENYSAFTLINSEFPQDWGYFSIGVQNMFGLVDKIQPDSSIQLVPETKTAPVEQAIKFLSGLNLQDQPIAIQREQRDVLQALMKQVNPEKADK